LLFQCVGLPSDYISNFQCQGLSDSEVHFTLDIEKANDYFPFCSSDNIKVKMLQLFSLLPVGQKAPQVAITL